LLSNGYEYGKRIIGEEITMKQYFSKLHKKWINFKVTDCEESLLKYGYKIRVKK
jgi:hypothetical protein